MTSLLDTLKRIAQREQKSRGNEINEIDELSRAPWSAADWRDYYLERAGIRQFDGCYPREVADRLAWRETANRWWHERGSRVAAPACAGCGVIVASADSIPLPHGQRVHSADCLVLFGRRWLAEAAQALAAMGIPTPQGVLPDEAP
jgi:hypothetical protein